MKFQVLIFIHTYLSMTLLTQFLDGEQINIFVLLLILISTRSEVKTNKVSKLMKYMHVVKYAQDCKSSDQ